MFINSDFKQPAVRTVSHFGVNIEIPAGDFKIVLDEKTSEQTPPPQFFHTEDGLNMLFAGQSAYSGLCVPDVDVEPGIYMLSVCVRFDSIAIKHQFYWAAEIDWAGSRYVLMPHQTPERTAANADAVSGFRVNYFIKFHNAGRVPRVTLKIASLNDVPAGFVQINLFDMIRLDNVVMTNYDLELGSPALAREPEPVNMADTVEARIPEHTVEELSRRLKYWNDRAAAFSQKASEQTSQADESQRFKVIPEEDVKAAQERWKQSLKEDAALIAEASLNNTEVEKPVEVIVPKQVEVENAQVETKPVEVVADSQWEYREYIVSAEHGESNIRQQPNTESEAVGIIGEDAALKMSPENYAVARDGKWIPVKYGDDNKDGWVRADVISYRLLNKEGLDPERTVQVSIPVALSIQLKTVQQRKDMVKLLEQASFSVSIESQSTEDADDDTDDEE